MIHIPVGKKIITLEEVDSTNNYTARAYKDGQISHGTVIMAENQTNGKGQRGNIWQSEPFSNLTFSLLLTTISLSDLIAINHIAALSIVSVLERKSLNGKIKWPNDIYVNDRKIAGILIENIHDSSHSIHSIIGIGINVNQTSFGELNATSLKNEAKQSFALKEILLEFIQSFNEIRDQFQHTSKHKLLEFYNNKLWQKEISMHFSDQSGAFKGRIIGTDESGNIRLETDSGIREYKNGELIFKHLH